MWFIKKKSSPETDIQITPPPANSRVEIEVDKNANKEVKKQASQINNHVNNLLVENGFTLKIYLAAGGQYKHAISGNGKK